MWSTTSQRAAISPPGVDRLQLMFPEGDRNDAGPFAADCTTAGAGAGAGSGATVTVTGAGAGAGVTVTVTAGADTGDGAGLLDVARVEPADDEHPARVNAANATSHSCRRTMRCGACRFAVIREGSREGLGGFLALRHRRGPLRLTNSVMISRCRSQTTRADGRSGGRQGHRLVTDNNNRILTFAPDPE